MGFLGIFTLICFYICVFMHICVWEYGHIMGVQRTTTGVGPHLLYYLRQNLLLFAAFYARLVGPRTPGNLLPLPASACLGSFGVIDIHYRI